MGTLDTKDNSKDPASGLFIPRQSDSGSPLMHLEDKRRLTEFVEKSGDDLILFHPVGRVAVVLSGSTDSLTLRLFKLDPAGNLSCLVAHPGIHNFDFLLDSREGDRIAIRDRNSKLITVHSLAAPTIGLAQFSINDPRAELHLKELGFGPELPWNSCVLEGFGSGSSTDAKLAS